MLIPEPEEGGYSVVVPGLPGCVSQGETREEALENIRIAIEEYLATIADSTEGHESVVVTVRAQVA